MNLSSNSTSHAMLDQTLGSDLVKILVDYLIHSRGWYQEYYSKEVLPAVMIKDMVIPLKFWFNRNTETRLSLCILPYNEVKISFDFTNEIEYNLSDI